MGLQPQKKKVLLTLMVLLLLIVVICIDNRKAGASEQPGQMKNTDFTLTKEEEKYLKSLRKKPLTLAVSNSLEYSTGKGKAQGLEYKLGMAVPFINFLEYELGLTVIVKQGEWPKLYKESQNGTIDLLFGIPVHEDLPDSFYLALPMYKNQVFAMANRSNDSRDFEYLKDITIGLEVDSPQSYYIMPYLHSARKIRYYQNTEELLHALDQQLVDMVVLNSGSVKALTGRTDLRMVTDFPELAYDISVGTCIDENKKLLDLFSRYFIKSGEGKEFLDEVKQQRDYAFTHFFNEKEAALIQSVQGQFEEIKVFLPWMQDIPMYYPENGEYKGIYAEMFRYFEELSGIPFVMTNESEDVVLSLERNEVQLAATIIKTQDKNTLFPTSDKIYGNRLVLVSKADSPAYTIDDIPEYYWGVEENILPLLNTSVLNGHLVNYNTMEELLAALDNGEVAGILLKESVADYYNLSDSGRKYRKIAGVAIPFMEQLSYQPKNVNLNLLLDRLLMAYQLNHIGYDQYADMTALNYEDKLLAAVQEQNKSRHIIVSAAALAGAVILILAAAFVVALRKYRWMKVKLKSAGEEDGAAHLLEVDLRKGRIRSSEGFQSFGLHTKKKSSSLKDLTLQTGFDFLSYYEKAAGSGDGSFEEVYSLRVNGRRCTFHEIGKIFGSTVTSVLTEIDRSKK